MSLSIVIITYNEESNLPRTLQSVQPLVENGQGEIILVDSHSTDRTVEIAKSFGAKVFVEDWKGFAAQKNSAIGKAAGDWILSLDADEEVDPALAESISSMLQGFEKVNAYAATKGYRPRDVHGNFQIEHEVSDRMSLDIDCFFDGCFLRRKNFFLGRWIKHGGFWPDPKLRLFRRDAGRFEDRAVHEDVKLDGIAATDIGRGALLHHAYPTLSSYIEHMNRYSTLGAEMAVAKGYRGFSFIDIVLRPIATFVYNYIFRLGFLDGREGLLLHLYHSVYVSWKYAKAWEMTRGRPSGT